MCVYGVVLINILVLQLGPQTKIPGSAPAHLQINAFSFFAWVWGNFPIKLVCIPTAKCHCFPHSKFIPVLVESGWTSHHYTVWIKQPIKLVNKGRLQPVIKPATHNLVSVVSHKLMQLPRCPSMIMFKQFTSRGYCCPRRNWVSKVIIRQVWLHPCPVIYGQPAMSYLIMW